MPQVPRLMHPPPSKKHIKIVLKSCQMWGCTASGASKSVFLFFDVFWCMLKLEKSILPVLAQIWHFWPSGPSRLDSHNFFESIALVYVEKSYMVTQNVFFFHFSYRVRFFDQLSKTVFGQKTTPEQSTPIENRCK